MSIWSQLSGQDSLSPRLCSATRFAAVVARLVRPAVVRLDQSEAGIAAPGPPIGRPLVAGSPADRDKSRPAGRILGPGRREEVARVPGRRDTRRDGRLMAVIDRYRQVIDGAAGD